jgi:tetratricopeptide (TPR) repeat protein
MREAANWLVLLLAVPVAGLAQGRLEDSTSMEVMVQDDAARGCYRAASIAARIHYTSERELENCTEALERGAMSPRDRAATLTNRGIIYMALSNFDMALQDFNAALALRPDFGEIHVNMGNIYFLKRQYGEAVGQYGAAIDKQTGKAHIAHINRGMAYERLGNFDAAEQNYRDAMAILPDSALPQVRLDELARKRKEAEQGQGAGTRE